MPKLLVHAFQHGAPRGGQILTFLAVWILPQPLRRRLRATLSRRRPAARLATDIA